MLKTILSLFGRSPFAPLQAHMKKVETCVEMVVQLFEALEQKNYDKLAEIAEKISELEHQADLTKNDIRNHLPKSLYLPIDRGYLLEILGLQDAIADRAEDIGVLCTLKKLELLPDFTQDFHAFLHKNLECFKEVSLIIHEMHELLESSFGGREAEKVRNMVQEVAYKEHEADLIQKKLLRQLFSAEDKMSYSTFYLWQKIFGTIASISDLSENLANKVRMTLEVK